MARLSLTLVLLALVCGTLAVVTADTGTHVRAGLRERIAADLARVEKDIEARRDESEDELTERGRENVFLGVSADDDKCADYAAALKQAGNFRPPRPSDNGRPPAWMVPATAAKLKEVRFDDEHLRNPGDKEVYDFVMDQMNPATRNNPLNAENFIATFCMYTWAGCKKRFLAKWVPPGENTPETLADVFAQHAKNDQNGNQPFGSTRALIAYASGKNWCDIRLPADKAVDGRGRFRVNRATAKANYIRGKSQQEWDRRCTNRFNRAVMRALGAMRQIVLCRIRLKVWIKNPKRYTFPNGPKLESLGSEDPTSDIDVNLKGEKTEDLVRMGNEVSKEQLGGRALGSLYDVNLYALDYMPKAYFKSKTYPPPLFSDTTMQMKNVANNDVFALMKVFQYDTEAGYEKMKNLVLAAIGNRNNAVKEAVKKRFEIARKCQNVYSDTLLGRYNVVNNKRQETRQAYRQARTAISQAWNAANPQPAYTEAVALTATSKDALHILEHKPFTRNPLHISLDEIIHASNAEYEHVLKERAEVARHLKTAHKNAKDKLQLKRELLTGWATAFSNEPMNSRGAVVSVVGGHQGCVKWRFKTSPFLVLQSLIENFGDIFKELGHPNGAYTINDIIAASKYLVRAGDAWWNLNKVWRVTPTVNAATRCQPNFATVYRTEPLAQAGRREPICIAKDPSQRPLALTTQTCFEGLVSRKFHDLLLIKKRREPYGGSSPAKIAQHAQRATTILSQVFNGAAANANTAAAFPAALRKWWAQAVADAYVSIYQGKTIQNPTIPDNCDIVHKTTVSDAAKLLAPVKN